MRENRVLVLPINILTVWRAGFTWPHDTLPCVLIFKQAVRVLQHLCCKALIKKKERKKYIRFLYRLVVHKVPPGYDAPRNTPTTNTLVTKSFCLCIVCIYIYISVKYYDAASV